MAEDGTIATGDHGADDTVMELLAGHVPITLLVDLAEAPQSEELLQTEGLPEQSWWEPTE